MLQLKIPDSYVVKNTVNATLKDRRISAGIAGSLPYVTCLVLLSVYEVVALLLSREKLILTAVFLVVGVFLFLPAFLGVLRWFWRMAEGLDDPVSEIFYYFKGFFLYKRAVKCILFLTFKCAVGLFVCLLPFFIVNILSNAWIYQFLGTEIPLWVAGLAVVEAFLRLVGIIIGILVISRYYLFPALVVMDDNTLLLEAMHSSVVVSKRSVSYFLSLIISMLGWIILSVFMIPIFYTAPLFFTAYVVHARYAIANHNQNIDKQKKDEYDFQVDL